MKEALKAFADMVKHLPFLRYAYPVFAVIILLALLGSYNLQTSKVFVAALLLIVLAFICYIFFSLLPHSNDSFLKWVRNIFAAFLAILAALILTALASYAVFKEPQGLKEYFQDENEMVETPDSVMKADDNFAEPVGAREDYDTSRYVVERFAVRIDRNVDTTLRITTANVDGVATRPNSDGNVVLKFIPTEGNDMLAINFRNSKVDIIRIVAWNPLQDTFALRSETIRPPKRVNIVALSSRYEKTDLTVETVTSGDSKSDTDDWVGIELYGEHGSLKRRLNKNKRDDFKLNALNAFKITYDSDIGKIKKAILRIRKAGSTINDWKIRSLTIRDNNRKIYYTSGPDRWLGDDEDPKLDSLVIERFAVFESNTRTVRVQR